MSVLLNFAVHDRGKSGKGKYVLALFMVCTGETSLT